MAAPKCNGVAIDSKSNFSVALDALKNCSASIKASCEVSVPADLEAKVKACNDASEKYRVDFRQKLVKATEGTICANAATLNASWVAVEKACSVDVDVAKEEAAQLEQKKTCQKAFGECRKQERALPAEMNTCIRKCSGSTNGTKSEAEQKLENLNKQKAEKEAAIQGEVKEEK